MQRLTADGNSLGLHISFTIQDRSNVSGVHSTHERCHGLEEGSKLTIYCMQVPSSAAGLGGVPVDAPPRQHSQIDQPQRSNFATAEQPPATAWAPKTSTSAGSQSLGGSILNSIPPQSYGSAHSNTADAVPSSSPRAPQQQGLGNTHSAFGQSPMVIPSPNHQVARPYALVLISSEEHSCCVPRLEGTCCLPT